MSSGSINTNGQVNSEQHKNGENKTFSSDFSLNIAEHIYEIKSVTTDIFDSFVKNHSNTDVCQLTSWAKVKSPAWVSEQVALFCDDKMVGAASLLFRKIPMTPWTLCYSPRGFLVNFDNPSDVEAMVKACIHVAKKYRAFEIKIDPSIERKNGEAAIRLLKENGFAHKGFTMGIVDSQPRFAMITDIDKSEEEVFNSFEKKAQRFINKSEKFQLDLKEYGEKGTAIFDDIMHITGERNKFLIRDKAYFDKVLDSLGPNDAELYIVSTTYYHVYKIKSNEKKSLLKEKESFQKKKEKLIAKIEEASVDEETIESFKNKIVNFDDKIDKLNIKIDSVSELINHSLEQKIEGGQGDESIYLSGALMVYCGPIAYYLYGASTNEYRDLLPNYFMQWELMKIAKQKGCKFYDFGGVSGYTDEEDLKKDDTAGLYYFKKTFGTVLFERIGEFDLVIKPCVKGIFNTAMKLRKKLLSLKKH